MSTAILAIYRDMEYAKSLIKQRASPAAEILSDESWTLVDDEIKSPSEELPEFKSSRTHEGRSHEGHLRRLSKKFNLPTATTALNPIAGIRALKQQREQQRDELAKKPSEDVDVAEVRTIFGN